MELLLETINLCRKLKAKFSAKHSSLYPRYCNNCKTNTSNRLPVKLTLLSILLISLIFYLFFLFSNFCIFLVCNLYKYFITCTKGKVLLKPFTCYFFPVTSDVNSFPFSRCCYILALRFCNLKPFFPAFLTQIPFDNKAASGIYQNGYIINVIITRIKPYQKRFISKLPTQVYCLEKELHSTVLAVFLQLRHFCKS